MKIFRMSPILEAIIWSIMPISELRGGIPIAIYNGINPWVALFICVVANFLVVPIVFFFLDYLHKFFMKINFYKKAFDKFVDKKRALLENKIGTKGEFIALMLFVGIPLPITGAYTGTLLAWFFKVPRKKAYAAIGLGVVLAGLIVTLVIQLGIKALSFFVR